MRPAGFEPAIPAIERPQSHALDRATTGIGVYQTIRCHNPEYQNTSWFSGNVMSWTELALHKFQWRDDIEDISSTYWN